MALTKLQAESLNLADTYAFTGTVSGAGESNVPAFQASIGTTSQSVSDATVTLAQFSTELFDSNGCFNNTGSTVTLNGISTPAYAFAPNVSGKYLIYGSIKMYDTSGGMYLCQQIIKKNGTDYSTVFGRDNRLNSSDSNFGYTANNLQIEIIEFNGTSDYIQLYGYNDGDGTLTFDGHSSPVGATNDSIFGAFLLTT